MPGEKQLHFDATMEKNFPDYSIVVGGEINQKVERQLINYFSGQLKRFTIKLDIIASDFQVLALREVARIPYGKTASYGEIAHAIGSPRASRAVGTANAQNNIPIIIPCHRVVASNGLGGYGGGIEIKKKLLRHEGAL